MAGMECPHYPTCGGCSIQHLSYEEQLRLKAEEVARKFGREPDEVIPSPKVWHYRNRMDYAVGPRLEVGLRRRGRWWSYVDITECLLQSEESDVIRNEFRKYLVDEGLEGYDTRRHRGLVRYLVVREGKFTGERMVAIITTKPAAGELSGFSRRINVRVDSLINGIYDGLFDTSRADRTIVIEGRDYIIEKLLDYRYMIRVNTFFQTNPHTAEIMVKIVMDEAKGFRKAYDLYSGVGTFTIPLSEVVDEVHGVELDREAVELARENSKLNGASPRFHAMRVESLPELDSELVVMDPPRAGVHPAVLKLLVRWRPKKLVYVSCNPKRQAEEVALLSNAYELERLIMIDQFPHTDHIESIAVMLAR